MKLSVFQLKRASEYDQEIPQSLNIYQVKSKQLLLIINTHI